MPKRLFDGSTPGPGRPKGVPTKATVEVRALCQRIVNDPAYQAALKKRLESGDIAPQIEALVWFYAYGKPQEALPPPVEVQAEAQQAEHADSYSEVVELYRRAIAAGVLPKDTLASIAPPSNNGHEPQ